MSNKLKSGFNRNSFDRFGYDLCEYILQYLSFEHKIKYECVCKQLKTTIFNRQKLLSINCKPLDNNTVFVERVLAYYGKDMNELNGISIIERLLQKCKNIYYIFIEFNENKNNWIINELNITYSQLLRIIADNCHHLLSICITTLYKYEINNYWRQLLVMDNMWQYFGSKRGKTLQSIRFPQSFISHVMSRSLLHFCTNVYRLINIDLKDLINNNSNEILVPKLEEIKISDYCSEEIMNIFVKRYVITIRVLVIGLRDEIFNHISELVNLRKLFLRVNLLSTDLSEFVRIFENISTNCKHIKHLTIKLNLNKTQHFSMIHLFKCINNFAKLEYLVIIARKYIILEPYGSVDKLSVNLLNNCVQLKSLDMYSNLIDDEFFDNIGDYLPNLKRIWINSFRISCKTIFSLTKLKFLERIDHLSLMMTDNYISSLFHNCYHLKSLEISLNGQITTATIDKLIEIAKQRPKINFNIKFIGHNSYKQLEEYTINQKILTPLNLNIIFKLY